MEKKRQQKVANFKINFDESKVVDTDDLFDDTSMFPTIPM